MPKKQIAPRLANGDSRLYVYAAFPESVKHGLRAIARSERQSVNWVIEQVVIDYFGLKKPKYKGQIK